jgi:transposase InsO family protein
MVWRVLRREAGQPWTGINHKRVQRLWREEGLRRPVRTRKRRRVATGTAERLCAERPNHVWAIDFEFDETADGRRLKLGPGETTMCTDVHGGSGPFAHTEAVTGSSSVAPTTPALTSRNAGQFAVWGAVRRAMYRMKSVFHP